MTNTYLNQLINEFDQEFESLVIPFPKSYVVNAVEVDDKKEDVITATDNFSNENQDMKNDFFQLLNQDNNTNLDQVLTDFDFYLDNPYKKKAEKILSKIEARKNK